MQPELSFPKQTASRIVIPEALRSDVLSQLHEGHQGLTKWCQCARSMVWWPSIGAQLTKRVKPCDFCVLHKPTQKHEPVLPTLLPRGTWQRIAADLCEFEGKSHLIVVDYFSRDIEIGPLNVAAKGYKPMRYCAGLKPG